MANNYAVLRIEKLKSVSGATSRIKHNSREKGAPLTSPNNKKNVIQLIDLDKQKNYIKEGVSFSHGLKTHLHGKKLRKNACVAFEIVQTFSPGAISDSDLKKWSQKSFEWACKVFGSENLHSAFLHLDESTPHIHYVFYCETPDGRYCANDILRGPSHLRDLQTDYALEMGQFGLSRGLDKKITKARHEKTSRYWAENEQNIERLERYEKVFGDETVWDISQKIEFNSCLESDSQKLLERPKNIYFEDLER